MERKSASIDRPVLSTSLLRATPPPPSTPPAPSSPCPLAATKAPALGAAEPPRRGAPCLTPVSEPPGPHSESARAPSPAGHFTSLSHGLSSLRPAQGRRHTGTGTGSGSRFSPRTPRRRAATVTAWALSHGLPRSGPRARLQHKPAWQ